MNRVILLHGYPLDNSLWRDVVPFLEKKATVYTPNLPGFGDAAPLPGEPSMDAMADYLLGIYKSHNITSAVVVGMSLGGYVALAFAQRHPEKVSALGLLDSQAAADTEEGRANRFKLIERIRTEGTAVAAEALAGKMFAPANTEKFKHIVFAGAEKAGPPGLTWALEAMAKRPDLTTVLKSLQVPVSIIHGKEDQIIPKEKARTLAEMAPRAKYVEIVGAGHGAPLETPQEVAEAILDLLRRSIAEAPILPQEAKANRPPITIAPTEHGL